MQPHVVPPATYLKVAAWLAVLMVLTVWVAVRWDLDAWNTPVALAIAIAKAVLILLFFMHVRYTKPLVQVFAASGFLWLIILFALTFSDVLTRPSPREMAPVRPPHVLAPPEQILDEALREPH